MSAVPITGYDVSLAVDAAGVAHYAFAIRLPTAPAGPGSDYEIHYAHETEPGNNILTHSKKISNVPYAERPSLAIDEGGDRLICAYQVKDPAQPQALPTLARSISTDLTGTHWTR